MHNHHGDGPSMNQSIFQMGLSVETVSLYLLCCGLVDAGRSVTTGNLQQVWNGTPTALDEGLRCLEERNILRRRSSHRQGRPAYQLIGVEHWKR